MWNRRTIFLIFLLLFSFARGDFRVNKITNDTLRPRINATIELSKPNPNPPLLDKLDREYRYSLPTDVLIHTYTIKICAIRVQFQLDETDSSTGNGQFDLTADDSINFDPPPHNKSYFASHLEALSRYYKFVSHDKLNLIYDIFPEDENEAYTLPEPMGYYGPEGWFGSDPGSRLFGFFKDAIRHVDSIGSVPFCDYDVIIVFHAGSDWQNDVATFYPDLAELYPDIFIPSPYDLPTAYLILPDETLATCITQGIVMPEHAYQDGQTVLINGILAHEFGHYLGLVDLYSTYDFTSNIGYFSLMDNGHAAGIQLVEEETGDVYDVFGLLPTYPSAWERAYLGWENVVTLDDPIADFEIYACEIPLRPNKATIAKIDIDEFEYFLIENRQSEPWDDISNVAIRQDSITGVIMGIQYNDEFIGAYDFALPGAGILIWHVDEKVAYGDFNNNGINNFLDNTLQWDWERRFIDLEEASGIQGFDLWTNYFGELDDYYRYSSQIFDPYTVPNSDNNFGGRTGISIFNFSRSNIIMPFSFDYEGPRLDWRSTVGYPILTSPLLVDLNNDDSLEILAQSHGLLFAWNNDGSFFVPGSDIIQLIIFNSETIYVPIPLVYNFEVNITEPKAGDIDGDGRIDIVLGDELGRITALNPETSFTRFSIKPGFPIYIDYKVIIPPTLYDIDNDGKDEIIAANNKGRLIVIKEDEILWEYELGGFPVGLFGLPDGRIIAVAQQTLGRVFLFSADGELLKRFDLPVGDLQVPAIAMSETETLIILTSRQGRSPINENIFFGSGKPVPVGESNGQLVIVNLSGEIIEPYPVELAASPSGPVLSDEDDGLRIFFTTDSSLYCYHLNGSLCENFPVEFRNDVLWDSPIIIDVDDDSNNDILVSSEESKIYAVNMKGEILNDFPIALGTTISTPSAGDIDNDGVTELVLSSFDGVLYVWDELGKDVVWPSFWYNIGGNRIFEFEDREIEPNAGAKLIQSFYNYPNPARDITYFRFRLNEDKDVRIKIYDDAGNLIDELTDRAHAGLPCEILWRTTKVASGVYWAIIEVDDKTIRKPFVIVK